MQEHEIQLHNLTPGQTRLLHELTQGYKLVVWISPTGQGKTVGMCIATVELALDRAERGLTSRMMFASPTIGQFIDNTEEIFQDVCDQYGVKFRSRMGSRSAYFIGDFGYARIVGGNDVAAVKRAMGASTILNWVDEAPHTANDVIDAIITRNRKDDAITILTGNAENPFSPIKLKYVDNTPPDTLFFEVDYFDNQHYGDKQREFLLAPGVLSEHMKKRLIDNVWAPAEGLVYPVENWMLTDTPIEKEPWGVVSYDEGISGITGALLWVQTGYDTWEIAEEYYHKASNTLQTIESHLYAMMNRWNMEYIIIDPTAAAMRAQAMSSGVPVVSADNRVEEGIQSVNNALHRGRVKINQRCVNLLTEMSAYAYNPQTDKPVKRNDHLCDALRYGCMRLAPNPISILSHR